MFIPFHDDNPTRRTPVVTLGLIAANVVVLLWLGRLPPLRRELVAVRQGFVPARVAQLLQPKPRTLEIPIGRVRPTPLAPVVVVPLRPVPREVALSLVTCMFLHGGWMHLIGNMWFLWLFGNNVEDRLGPLLFSLLYLLGGIVASATHWAMYPRSTVPVIGASGAVAAVLGAYAITWPHARVRTLVFLFFFFTVIELPAVLVLGGWFVGQLLAGQGALAGEAAESVAWWAHVGGFLAGLALMPLLRALSPEQPRYVARRIVDENREDDPVGFF